MELQPGEEELWNLVLEAHENDPGERIRIVPLGEQLGMHPQRARQFARTWKNRGWISFSNPNRIYVIEDKPISDNNDS